MFNLILFINITILAKMFKFLVDNIYLFHSYAVLFVSKQFQLIMFIKTGLRYKLNENLLKIRKIIC